MLKMSPLGDPPAWAAFVHSGVKTAAAVRVRVLSGESSITPPEGSVKGRQGWRAPSVRGQALSVYCFGVATYRGDLRGTRMGQR